MNPLRHDLQHLAYLVRRWFANRRMRREEVLDNETPWLPGELRDLEDEQFVAELAKRKGRRHSGRHARPGDIPNQPPAGRES